MKCKLAKQNGYVLKHEERTFLIFLTSIIFVVLVSVATALYIFNYYTEHNNMGWLSLGVGALFIIIAKLSHASGYETGYLAGKHGDWYKKKSK